MKLQEAAAKPCPRIVVNQPATVEDAAGGKFQCNVIDVSHQGFRLKVPQPLVPGSVCTLHLEQETHRIEIRWASPGEVGGLFLERLD